MSDEGKRLRGHVLTSKTSVCYYKYKWNNKIFKIDSASIIAFMLVDIFCCFRTVFVNQTVVYICKNFQAVVAWSSTLLVLIFFLWNPPPHSLSTVPIIFKKKNGLTICYRIAQFSAYAYIHIDNISKSRLSNLVQCMCVRKWLEYRLPFDDLRVNAYSYWQSLGFVVWEGNLNAVLVAIDLCKVDIITVQYLYRI